jgi:hypothetical protein
MIPTIQQEHHTKDATSSKNNLFGTTPDRHNNKTTAKLLLAIHTTLESIASSTGKKLGCLQDSV